MSDQRPPEPGGHDPATGETSDVPPAMPAIDLSEPEEPAPTSPVDGGALVSAPDAGQPADAAPAPPRAPDDPGTVPPLPPTPPADAGTADAPEPEAAARSGGQAWKMVLVVVIFLAVVVVAYVLGKNGGGDSEDQATPTSSTTVNTQPVDTSSWSTFTDDAAGFTIKHPKDWERLPTQSAERLVLRAGAESAAQVTVRNIESSTAPEVIQQVMADSSLVESPREFDLNGLPAVVYIFNTPVDADSPDPGVAVQYFVVGPHKLHTIVFVTRPPEEINRLGRIFSAVASTFKSTSDTPAPEPSSTTTTSG